MSESSQGHIASVTAGLGLVVGLLVATAFPQVLVAQSPVTPPATQPPGTLPATPQPFEQPDLPGQLLNGSGMQSFGLQGGGQGGIDEFTSIWSRPTPPQFSGFPSFPSTLPGYGNYPLPSNQATGNPMSLVLPPAVAGPPGWPAWVRSEARKPLPFGMTTGLLIGQEGRVWHSDAKDEPFVPIRFHDKFAALTVGATIETRGAGAFELLLETTTRVETRGATAMKTLTLDDETVHLQFDKLSWLRITATSRTNRVTLPDGSVLEMNTSSAGGAPSAGGLFGLFGSAGAATPQSPPLVEIRRIDEPSWYGGRATMANLGGSDVLWKHAFGETRIEPKHRVTFFLTPPTTAASAALATPNTRMSIDGDTVTCKGTKATAVQWCGAKIQLKEGQTVTFESLGGSFSKLVEGVTPPVEVAATNPPNLPTVPGPSGG